MWEKKRKKEQAFIEHLTCDTALNVLPHFWELILPMNPVLSSLQPFQRRGKQGTETGRDCSRSSKWHRWGLKVLSFTTYKMRGLDKMHDKTLSASEICVMCEFCLPSLCSPSSSNITPIFVSRTAQPPLSIKEEPICSFSEAQLSQHPAQWLGEAHLGLKPVPESSLALLLKLNLLATLFPLDC